MSTPRSPYTMNNVDTSLEDAIYADDSAAEESYCSQAASLQLDELLPADSLPPAAVDVSTALDAVTAAKYVQETSVVFLGDVTEDDTPALPASGIMKILGLTGSERSEITKNNNGSTANPPVLEEVRDIEGGQQLYSPSAGGSSLGAGSGIYTKGSVADTEPESPEKLAPAAPLSDRVAAVSDVKESCDRRWYAAAAVLALIAMAIVIPLVVIESSDSTGGSNSASSNNEGTAPTPTIEGTAPTPTIEVTAPTPTLNASTPAPFALIRNTRAPSLSPTSVPTVSPITSGPTFAPTSGTPTLAPTFQPTAEPAPTATPSLVPSGLPTRVPTTMAPTRVPLDFFSVVSTVTASQDLLLAGTPQFAALKWLEQTDEFFSTISPVDLTERQILQRYALVVADISLHADGQPAAANTLETVCDWSGVSCNFFSEVVNLNWANSGLDGHMPSELGVLQNLTVLDLAENQIVGEIPDAMYDLANLKSLYLHSNKITGGLSERIDGWYGMVNLYLGSNEMTGEIPANIGSLGGGRGARPLRILSLRKNNFTGQIPPNLGFRFMYYLDLSYNQFSGQLPLDWSEGSGSLSRIRHLHLDNNQFDGVIPATFPLMGNGRIEQLSVNNNRLTGEVPGGWPLRNHLISLEVQNNFFSRLGNSNGGFDVCELIVFQSGEMVDFNADCSICSCNNFCSFGECF